MQNTSCSVFPLKKKNHAKLYIKGKTCNQMHPNLSRWNAAALNYVAWRCQLHTGKNAATTVFFFYLTVRAVHFAHEIFRTDNVFSCSWKCVNPFIPLLTGFWYNCKWMEVIKMKSEINRSRKLENSKETTVNLSTKRVFEVAVIFSTEFEHEKNQTVFFDWEMWPKTKVPGGFA